VDKQSGLWSALYPPVQNALPAISFYDGVVFVFLAVFSCARLRGQGHVRDRDLILAHVRDEFDGRCDFLAVDWCSGPLNG
jgi:hypothetical protein